MSDKPTPDLGAAMKLLLEQELMTGAGIGNGAPSPAPTAAAPSETANTVELDRLEDDVLRIAADALRMHVDQVDPTENLANFGVDSIAITEVMVRISRAFGISVAPTTFFEARHLNDLARILRERHGKALTAHYAKTKPIAKPTPEPAIKATPEPATKPVVAPSGDDVSAWLSRHRAVRRAPEAPGARPVEAADVPIAIISMAGKFPQSPDLEALEAHLRQGDDCIEEVPAGRWDWRAVHGNPRKGPFTDVKYGGFVAGHDRFDAAFFNISPREAELMDPQHRLFIECVWTLIERAGYAPSALSGKKVGLFLGINLLDYVDMVNSSGIMDAQQMTGLGHVFCPNRLSFLLDIHGPSQVIDTACSSSLVALHRAVMSIRHEGCDMAIAGGSNLMLSPKQHILFSQTGMISPGGRCRTFSRHADGYARADGVGAVLLKRLDLAERDGDAIEGVIRASSEHHGGTTTSLTAPNPKAQARLIVEAHRRAGIDPRSITMIECHGTGTSLGDPLEIEGLKTAFDELYRDKGLPRPALPHCGLGSLKSNIGHTETCAGIAGLIKVLLAMRSGIQYRTLHCEEVNPLIDLADSPFYLLNEARPWNRPVVEGVEAPRRAGVSSFGAGGSNVHVVLEEYRPAPDAPATPGRRPLVVPVSARDEDRLQRTVAELRAEVDSHDPDDFAYTLQVGRDARRARVAFVAEDGADLARQMDAFLAGDRTTVAHGRVERRRGNGTVIDPADLSAADIAARWATGATVDWPRLHDHRRRRLSLPGTPFAGKRFWFSSPPAAVASPRGFELRPSGTDRWQVDLDGTEFFLTDHRLNGQPILPGVAYLELARTVAAHAGLSATAFRHVVWIQPMAVNAPLTVDLTLVRDDNGTARQIEIASLSATTPRRLHAQLRPAEASTPSESACDLSALQESLSTTFTAERIYGAFDAMGLNYGPAHRAIARLTLGRDAKSQTRVLARLSMPDAVASTLAAYPLHPSLMDGAFQAAVGFTLDADGHAPEGAALPFAVESVEILGPCEADMWVDIRPAARAEAAPRVRTLDLDVMDATGRVRVRLRGFATRLPEAERRNETVPAVTQMFVPVWREPIVTSIPDTRLALLCDDVAEPETLAPHLPDWTCRAVGAGSTVPLEQRFETLAREVLAELQARTSPTLIQVVLADDPKSEAMAGITGMLRSAAQENPAIAGQVVTVPSGLEPSILAEKLKRAATAPAGARMRLEDDALWQEAWEPVAPASHPAPWRDGKVYLVTGGLGGLGRHIACAIRASAPRATVVLAGRSPLGPEARAWLESRGDGIEYERVDLADETAARALVEGIRGRHGHLDGVIHAAGLLRDAPLAAKTTDHLASVLAPKVAGTVNLDRAIGTEALDFFVLFSSLSGVLGNPGQTDYAAANGFLDGFATTREVRRRAGLVEGRTIAVAWPLWAEGGMTIDAATRTLMTRTTGLVPLETNDGLAALYAALAMDAPRLSVAVGDAERVRRHITDGPASARPRAATATPVVSVGLEERVLAELMTAAAHQLKVDLKDLADDVELSEYGFDSIGFTQFANALNDRFDLELTPTVFFEYPTLSGLAGHLSTNHGAVLADRLGIRPATVSAETVIAPEPQPVLATPPATAPTPVPSAATEDAVAIIGMSGVFPEAEDVETFWHNLEQGRDCIGEIPADRWDWRDYWGDPQKEPGRCNVRWGGFMDGIARFDARFFGLSNPEARMMDPQQRLLLTQAWRLLEDAGYAPRHLSGSSTGVFIGIADSGYGRLLAQAGAGIEGYAMTGLAPSLGPNRISFHFNFHGPSVAVETACSSSLVAVHRAVEAIRAGHCEAAIAGGINTLLSPDPFVGFAKAGMLSPKGRCQTFSAAADGYARGEGVGLVFLKRLSAAENDGDNILAVIRASGENHGGRASSLTAPNPKAQAALLRTVYARAGFDPRTVGYIEAHGTGTPLGDPIEVDALKAAFADIAAEAETRYGPAPEMTCGLGSVKSNIGHLELAAGIAGLIKVVLQMRAGTQVKTLHCEPLNPYLKLTDSPFQVVRENRPWTYPRNRDGHALPRRAGVSSFGFGGANAHVVVEEYLPRSTPVAPGSVVPGPAGQPGPALMVLSAHAPEVLRQSAVLLRARLSDSETPLAEIAFSLQTAREPMEYRLAFSAASRPEALERIDAFLAGNDAPSLHQGRVKTNRSAISVLESDNDLRRAVAGLVARGRAEGLLELWVKGFEVDWSSLYGPVRPRRVPLPPYPFATTEHWVRRADAVTGSSPTLSPPTPEPIPTPSVPAVAHVSEPAPRDTDERDSFAVALAALTGIAARVLEVESSALDPDAELGEFGFDSISMTGFATQVNDELGLSLTPADFFEFATLSRLARHIADSIALPARAASVPISEPTAETPLTIAAPTFATARPTRDDDPIAIVGFSCRFPDAPDGDAFWNNLKSGRDSIGRIPADRWDWQAFDGDPKVEHGKTNIHWGGFIDGVFEFDPLFFGISPREAKRMDPQQRLMMMHAWKAIEDSGHAPRSLAGRKVGLFVGTSISGYRDIIGDDAGAEGYVATGAVPSIGPNRISFLLDWHGPSEPVETACSSSLVALHRAIQSMRAGDCDLAVAGGVNTIVTPDAHINFAKAGMLSPDGRCKTFSAQANGYGRGEGVGMLVLKPLSDARRDGDPILALVRASAINHGGKANSLTAPNTAAQAELVRDTIARAGIDPRSLGYIEAHGTGTALGDPVEINALKAAYRAAATQTDGSVGDVCGIGSVKSNIGHLELAAGAAGLIKVLLQMRHRTLVPSLHCAEINPYIDLTDSPFHIVRELEQWQPALDSSGLALPLRAGISSFGFGGVNAHVILEEYRTPMSVLSSHSGPAIAVLSARDGERLKDHARNLSAFIADGAVAEADLPDLAYTLQVGRDAMKHRLAIVVNSLAQLRERLDAFVAGDHTGLSTGKLDAGYKSGPSVSLSEPPDVIARRWVAGDIVDWVGLYREPRRRLRLPTYPFARDTHHVKADFGGSAALVAARPSADHAVRLEADAFYFRDHRVRGVSILPGAMGLELARAAFAAGGPFSPVVLRRVVWQHPLQLASGAVIATVPLKVGEDGTHAFRLLTGDADSTPHVVGHIAPLDETDALRLDVDRLRLACGKTMTADEIYADFAALGLDYGPAFQTVEKIFVGKGQALARLRLPTAASDTAFALHPSMVDGAFQAALGLFESEADGTVALPYGLDAVEAIAPTSAVMWAHLRRGTSGNGIHKLDIDLADADGTIVVRLLGFTLRVLKADRSVKSDLKTGTVRYLAALVAREADISVDDIEAEAPLEVYGIDSVMITRLTDVLEADFGQLPKTLFFEYRTLQTLADYFLSDHRAALPALIGSDEQTTPALPEPLDGSATRRDVSPPPANAPIAIIGMSGRYPGADDLEQFWRNLESGRDCITEIPADRWDHSRYYDPTPGRPGKTNSKWGGFVDGVDRFDPLFFSIAPREAEYLDPQERLFLQCAWETLEDAGYTRANAAPLAPPLDGGDVGVFVGVMYEEYQLYGAERTANGRPMALSGSAASIANRVSYFCGFHGPSLAVDSMCSSSLSAIHLACDALRAGSCRMALAGGVNLTLHPNKYLGLAQGRFMSSSGRCESFGRGGDGYVPGEGIGSVLLKPLAQAVADGDTILGIIRSSAMNHGGKTNGYTVPNPAAQTAVIAKAMDAAGVSPRMVSYVEAHGTGTSLGDPIEIAALSKAYARHTADTGFCAIGSVKSNIGHCESAAGIAGLAKVLLQFRHRRLVPSLHSETLNPGIDFAASPFVVQQRVAEWRRPVVDGSEGTRIAGLSSFGAGGANAHLILEEFVAPPAPVEPARRRVFPLSARDPDRLAEMAARLRRRLEALDETDMAAVAHTLQTGREAMEERLAIVATSRSELIAALDSAATGNPDGPNIHRGRAGRGKKAVSASDPDTIAKAWVDGATVDWIAPYTDKPKPRRIGLPPYPFARERYWIPEGAAVPAPAITAPLPLFFAPRWRDQAADGRAFAQRRIVMLCKPPEGMAERLVDDLSPAEVLVSNAEDYAEHAAKLLGLLQDLFKERPERAIVQLVVPLNDDGRLLEGLAGMMRSARQERPGVLCQTVALDYRSGDPAAFLNADQATADTDADIRHDNGRRQVRQWLELTVRARPTPWKDGGIYLITGGAGGIGLHVCAAIAEGAHRPALWLTGRSPLSDSARHRLERLDARTIYRQVDVTDPAAVAALIAEIRQVHGRLDGVLHAAGLVRDALLVRKSADDLRAVLSPKVAGALNLDAATADLDLDMMVLFASASGALGNAGQSDYAAANAFLDSFAAHRNRRVTQGERRGRTVSIDWPYWRDGGMRIGDEAIAAMERLAGVRPLETGPALAALTTAVALTEEDQILVLDGDPDRLRAALRPVPSEAPTPSPPTTTSRPMAATVTACFSRVLKIPAERLAADAPLDRFGVDSVSALEIVAALEQQVGPLPPTILFENPSIAQLAEALTRSGKATRTAPEPTASAPAADPDDIAIIAVAGRYPGADTIEDFWTALEEGRDCVTEIPTDRWDLAYSPAKGKPGTSHCKWGGFLGDIDCFDAEFFGYSPRAADLTDPQERLFLQTCWHLLERAGHTRARLRDHYDAKVGVFVGAMYQHYSAFDADAEDKALLLLNSYAGIANRISFFFDLKGPSVAVDSMCSSGLQAVHQACQNLKTGECRLAIAGGVNLSLHPGKYLGLSRTGLVGSTADSRSFAEGDGYLPAEGVGAVLLKPLADALRDGDDVIAVIKGSAANHGGHSAGFGVPSAEVQARLIEDNLRRSGIDARTIGYVEAAASGASMGDAIEIRALSTAFRAFGVEDGACAIGSVKSNMGHAEAASGLAQLTKVLLQLQHRRLVPSLKPDRANRAIVFDATPFRPQWRADDWPAPSVDGEPGPRRATVSSFGAGGSNVHLILEEAPARPAVAERHRPRAFPVSARTPEQLNETLRRLADFVDRTPNLSLARLSWTLRHGREPMEHAVTVTADDRDALIEKLRTAHSGAPSDPLPESAPDEAVPPLALPGYPFARERHWLPRRPSSTTVPVVAPAPDTTAAARAVIVRTLARELGMAENALAPSTAFATLGLDSMIALRLGYAIEEAHGVTLGRRDFEDHPTPDRLAALVAERMSEAVPTAAAVAPEPDDGPWRIPMTEGQKGLWVVQSLHPDTSIYNVPLAFRVNGIDRDALGRACGWLLDAFPVLTAQVDDDGAEPSLISRHGTRPLRLVEVPKGMDPLIFARQRAARPFDLKAEAPSRFELLHGGALGAGHEILLITVHHMVFDGASAAAVATALWEAYTRFADGREAPPPPTQADFSDFAAWERTFMASPEGQAQHAYWRCQLSGELPTIDLPSDRPASPGAAIDGRSLDRVLAAPVARAAKETAAALGITPASLLLGVLAILLYRHTGQTDILVGVPTLRRPARRFEHAVGYFVNMLAVRTGVSGELAAETVLRDSHRRLIEGLDNGEFPFAAIARDLGGSLQGEPPYQIGFAYQNFPMSPPIPLPPEAGQAVYLPEIRQPGDGPFGLEVYEEGETLRLVAGYDGARFDAAGIERLLDRYARLVAAVCAAPKTRVGTLEMLTPRERKRLSGRWAKAPALPRRDGLLPQWVARQAKRRPKAVAVTADGDSLTYRQLVRRANRLARHLRRNGVRPGDAVAVLLDRGTDSIVALIAALTAGAIWVPLDRTTPTRRQSAILADCGAKAIVTKGEPAAKLKTLSPLPDLIVDLDRDAKTIGDRSAEKFKPQPDPSAPAYMIYTSGSTGTPKGVVVSQQAIADHVRVIIGHYGLSKDDVVLQFAPHVVDTALEQILPTLASGGRLLMRTKTAWPPEALRRILTEQGVTVADLPPAYLREVLLAWNDVDTPPPSTLRLCVVGGETLTSDTVRLWQAGPLAHVRLLNAYGPTETTITCLVHEVDTGAPGPTIPIGRPLPGTEAYILDRDGNPVPEGVIGELHIAGSRLALGYHGRPDLTRERFVEPPSGIPARRLYRTGDMVSFVSGSKGLIAFHGRVDQQVKIRGFRVELSEVETALTAFGLREAAVASHADSAGSQNLTAYIVPQSIVFDEDALRIHMASRLPPHMLPNTYVRLPALPKTASGKLDRSALPNAPSTEVSGDKPRDNLEEQLLEVWSRVLERETGTIGIHDNFQDCGGHSLLWVRLLAALERTFHAQLPASAFLTAQTIAEQARVLRAQRGGDRKSAAERNNAPVALRPVNPTSSRTKALFLVHPIAGTVTCYVDLARRLKAAIPVYGLQAPDAKVPALSLPQMAAHHVRTLRRAQPSGPYSLGGWSFGGVLAFEMARQLRQTGEKVDLLCLIESYTPELLRRFDAQSVSDNAGRPLAQAFAHDLFGIADLPAIAEDQDVATALMAMPALSDRFEDDDIGQMRRMLALYEAHNTALMAYQPGPCDVPITVLRTENAMSDKTCGWAAVTKARVAVHILPGDHYSVLLPPNIDACTALVDKALAARRKPRR